MSRRYASSWDDPGTLAAYLREIAKLPRLSIDEERELGGRIQRDHDEAAITRLVESNLRFVVSCAKRYRGFGVSLLDLIHEGNLGLMEAARRFDPNRNVKFITYAVWWVREAMTHVLADQLRAFSFPPKLVMVLGMRADDVSLNDPTSQGGSQIVADTLPQDGVPPVDEEMIHQADVDGVLAALAALDQKERQVMRLRFGIGDDEPRTLQQIGERLRLSRERVRQIESRAKDKLRRAVRLKSHLN